MAYYNRRQFLTRSTLGFAGASLGLSALGARTAYAANTGAVSYTHLTLPTIYSV